MVLGVMLASVNCLSAHATMVSPLSASRTRTVRMGVPTSMRRMFPTMRAALWRDTLPPTDTALNHHSLTHLIKLDRTLLQIEEENQINFFHPLYSRSRTSSLIWSVKPSQTLLVPRLCSENKLHLMKCLQNYLFVMQVLGLLSIHLYV